MNEISKGTRIINFIIDLIIIYIVYIIISVIINTFFNFSIPNIIYYLIYLAYYFIFESYNAQTIGKMITKTVVVDLNNLKPNIRRIVLRTILRLNPFDAFSYLFGREQGAHDRLSKTRLKLKKST